MRDPLTSKQGFMLAAGISSYDDTRVPIEDEEIGTIKLYEKSWDVANVDTTGTLEFNEIPTRKCTYEDFGENSSLFYDLKPDS